MSIVSWIWDNLALIFMIIFAIMLVGQYFSSMADYYLAIENPRPLDENTIVIESRWWGFLTQWKSSRTAELAGQGLADVRVFATRKQVLCSLVTCGWKRDVTVVWRGNAGQHPLGQA